MYTDSDLPLKRTFELAVIVKIDKAIYSWIHNGGIKLLGGKYNGRNDH